MKCSKAETVLKPRFSGRVRFCYLDAKLEADKGKGCLARAFRDRFPNLQRQVKMEGNQS